LQASAPKQNQKLLFFFNLAIWRKIPITFIESPTSKDQNKYEKCLFGKNPPSLMEFGTVGLEGLASSSCGFASLSSIDHGKQKCCVSAGFLKQDTPVIVNHDDDGFRASKIAKVRDDLSASKVSSFVFSDDGQQEHNLLSFSSPKMEDFSLKCSADLDSKNLQKPAFPSYFQRPSSAHSKISGKSIDNAIPFCVFLVGFGKEIIVSWFLCFFFLGRGGG